MRIEEAFAEILRRQRHQKGLSQHALAYEAGINRNNISLYETAERLPSFATLFDICRVLEIKPNAFMKEVEEVYFSG